MQFSIAALLVAAASALAAPDRGSKPSRPDRIDNNRNHQSVTITCTGGSSYCCSPEYGNDHLFSHYTCYSALTNSCNAGGIIVCCNQVAQGVNINQKQRCSAFGDTKVIYV
ncbi:Hypothetical protein NCS54_00634500 [Fusarium falciforme]|uniref:Hypothetical protein n=1 Tax=Fusarium falciforme TaxID=195108 RepID=UPI0023005FED|nr:Hypothetical protein NCS54_00634500 [Fusarium falciforme]WAO88973.1 Hypothetical protein NCS54_00634500 [Fusarium falciforme]